MITRVKIDGYKSFRDFELEMKPLMVIFGPNATGKSNLLDALQLVSLCATEKNLKDAFEKHRGLPLESISKRSKFEVDLEINDAVKTKIENDISQLRQPFSNGLETRAKVTEKRLRYSLELEALPKGEPIVVDESLRALQQRNSRLPRKRNAFFERDDARKKIIRRMEGQGHPAFLDVGMDHTILSEGIYKPHHPHSAAAREEIERWKFFYLEPRTLMREDSPIKTIDLIGSRGENLSGFLFSLKNHDPRRFEALVRSLRTIIPFIEDLEVNQDPQRGTLRFVIRERGGGHFHPTLISEGTLRIIGLLSIASAITPPTVIGFEEPENGVHPDRLSLIAELLQTQARLGKQVIVTSHSTDFVGYFKDEDLFVCARDELGRTKITPISHAGPLFRKQAIREARRELR